MSHSRDGPGVTATLQTNLAPLTGVWKPPPPSATPQVITPATFGHVKALARSAGCRGKSCTSHWSVESPPFHYPLKLPPIHRSRNLKLLPVMSRSLARSAGCRGNLVPGISTLCLYSFLETWGRIWGLDLRKLSRIMIS